MARDRDRDAGMDQLLRAALTRAGGGPYRNREDPDTAGGPYRNREDPDTAGGPYRNREDPDTAGGPYRNGEDPSILGTAPACPSAGDLAAYVEGTLTADEREAMEPHLAACTLCQEALALIGTMPEAPARAEHLPRARAWWLAGWKRWLVPASALASAVILYVALKPDAALHPAAPSESVMETTPAAPPVPSPGQAPVPGTAPLPKAGSRAAADQAPPASRAEAPRGQAAGAPQMKSEAKDAAPGLARNRAQAGDQLAAVTQAPPVAAKLQAEPERLAAAVPQLAEARVPVAPAPPPPPAPAPTLPVRSAGKLADARVRETQPSTVGGVAALAPPPAEPEATLLQKGGKQAFEARADAGQPTVVRGGAVPAFLWRFEADGRILGSADEGRTWQLQHEAARQLAAGSAPSREVCWAVGPAGLVLRTTNGRTWQAVPFPEPLDLVAVTATGALHATVHARDGRVFTTADGGQTWEDEARGTRDKGKGKR